MGKPILGLIVVLLITQNPTVIAAECDPLTQRKVVQRKLPDSQSLLNRIANDRFRRGLAAANRQKCRDRESLEQAILKYLGNARIMGVEIPIGPQEFEVNRGKSKYLRDGLRKEIIPSLSIKKRCSVFKELTVKESAPIFVSIAALVRFDDLVISSDKFTHFFAQGYDYLEVYRSKGSVEAALRWGLNSERGSKGMDSTGVMSYGDLAANYGGLKFWLALTDPERGHVACRNGKWVQTRCFDWHEHITPAWDEGINIPCYRPGRVREKINVQICELVARRCIPQHPPLDRHRLTNLAESYRPEVLPWLINPSSLRFVAMP